MSNKLALVVDDSRMARHVLSKMLKEQGIDVDSVETGEEALGYLCDSKPSMIFMDHTMPGMDGFQCLRAIKNDPQTAMIPIIMYTSKEGEVYESQALALGAVDVLPKTLKPLMLAKVLERQNLLPHQQPIPKPSPETTKPGNNVVIMDNESSDQKARLATPALAAKSAAAEEHPELEALEQRIESLTSQLHGMNEKGDSYQKRNTWFQYLGLALGVVLVGWLLYSNNQLLQELSALQADKRELEADLRQQTQENLSMRADLESRINQQQQQSDASNSRFFESIEWALNEDGQFAWDEEPFNDRLAATLSRLAQNLSDVGFTGELNIVSHLGRFCLVTAATGEPELPETDTNLSNCEITQFTPALADEVGMDQTPGFERFLVAFQSQYGEQIKLRLTTLGDRRPAARYPNRDPDTSASRWNQAAARNQRIEISITAYQEPFQQEPFQQQSRYQQDTYQDDHD